jgi:ATP-dependent Zn protease
MALVGMSQQEYSDEDLAYHEAGHTVAAVLLGRTVTRVSIVRDDASRGVRVPSFNDAVEVTPAAVADKILILLAGSAAQHVRDPASPRRQDAKDWPRAEALAGSTSSVETEWERAVDFLQVPRHWDRVEDIAQALLRERVLEGEQIAQLMDRPR